MLGRLWSYKMQKNKQKFKWVILVLAWLATLADIITFFLSNTSFEVNAIYLISGNSIPVVIAVKIFVVLAWSALLFVIPRFQKGNFKEFMIFLEYLLVIAGIGLIVMQTFGAISNLKIAAENPSLERVVSKERAMDLYSFSFIIPYLIAVVICAVLYFLFRRKKR